VGSNDFTGRLVLVTGAGSGIGLETALAFARAGARLVITDVNEAALAAARAAVTALGAECLARRCDVSDEQDMGALAEHVNERAGVPHILVNNAGIGYFGLFLDTPTVAWRRAFEVNVMGVVNGIRAFLPAMRAAGGERWVVNVASAAGFAPAPSMSAYAASKHAVVGLSEVLAMELEGSGVRVLMVCPGVINTPIVAGNALMTPEFPQAQVRRLQAYYMAKGCAPREVAEALLDALGRGDIVVFAGPLARMSSVLMRISRRLARRVTLAKAREIGYL
jgi:NAD(P)-dependent dehydrogenase (short-subunit alcohol dehydrogenase family)